MQRSQDDLPQPLDLAFVAAEVPVQENLGGVLVVVYPLPENLWVAGHGVHLNGIRREKALILVGSQLFYESQHDHPETL